MVSKLSEDVFEQLKNLPYTDKSVNEILRLYPPAWAIGRENYEEEVGNAGRIYTDRNHAGRIDHWVISGYFYSKHDQGTKHLAIESLHQQSAPNQQRHPAVVNGNEKGAEFSSDSR